MALRLAFLPHEVEHPESSVCVVVDVLRATSTIATLFGRGADHVIVAGDVDTARRLHLRYADALLCGEEQGLPPPGFRHGNSPVEYASVDVRGRSVVLATSNGTRALSRLAGARAVFTGSLLNLSASATAAERAAQAAGVDLWLVASGNALGTRYSVDDVATAGAILERLLPGESRGPLPAGLDDRVVTAIRLWRSYQRPRQIFTDSEHGRALIAIGLEADLDACARIDRFAVAPQLSTDDGVFVLTDALRDE